MLLNWNPTFPMRKCFQNSDSCNFQPLFLLQYLERRLLLHKSLHLLQSLDREWGRHPTRRRLVPRLSCFSVSFLRRSHLPTLIFLPMLLTQINQLWSLFFFCLHFLHEILSLWITLLCSFILFYFLFSG